MREAIRPIATTETLRAETLNLTSRKFDVAWISFSTRFSLRSALGPRAILGRWGRA